MLLVTLSLSFLVPCWCKHYLVKTREPNITNHVQNKAHDKYKPEHGGDYYESEYYGLEDYKEKDSCDLCNECQHKHYKCNQPCVDSYDCDNSYCKYCNTYSYNPSTFEATNICGPEQLLRGLKKGGCFASTSLVETREGIKFITDLRIGDEIRTLSDNLQTEFTEVGKN